MKKLKLDLKKISLKKETVSKLSKEDMIKVSGGATGASVCDTYYCGQTNSPVYTCIGCDPFPVDSYKTCPPGSTTPPNTMASRSPYCNITEVSKKCCWE